MGRVERRARIATLLVAAVTIVGCTATESTAPEPTGPSTAPGPTARQSTVPATQPSVRNDPAEPTPDPGCPQPADERAVEAWRGFSRSLMRAYDVLVDEDQIAHLRTLDRKATLAFAFSHRS